MPNSTIKKVEEMAERDRVKKGLNFRKMQKELFSLENEDYNYDQNEQEEEMLPYFPGKELEDERTTPAFEQEN